MNILGAEVKRMEDEDRGNKQEIASLKEEMKVFASFMHDYAINNDTLAEQQSAIAAKYTKS